MQHGGQITAATPLQVRARDDPRHSGAEQAPECLMSDPRGPNAPPGSSQHFTGPTGPLSTCMVSIHLQPQGCTPTDRSITVRRLTVIFPLFARTYLSCSCRFQHTDIHCLHNIHTLRYSTSFRHRLCPQGHLLAPLKFFNPSLSPIALPYARPFDYSLPRLHQVSSLTHTALSHRALPLRPATRIAPPHSPGATRPALLPSATSHVTARTRTSLTSSRAPCHDVCSSLSRPALRRRATFMMLHLAMPQHHIPRPGLGPHWPAPCTMHDVCLSLSHSSRRAQTAA